MSSLTTLKRLHSHSSLEMNSETLPSQQAKRKRRPDDPPSLIQFHDIRLFHPQSRHARATYQVQTTQKLPFDRGSAPAEPHQMIHQAIH
jgi:hypothetical protein